MVAPLLAAVLGSVVSSANSAPSGAKGAVASPQLGQGPQPVPGATANTPNATGAINGAMAGVSSPSGAPEARKFSFVNLATSLLNFAQNPLQKTLEGLGIIKPATNPVAELLKQWDAKWATKMNEMSATPQAQAPVEKPKETSPLPAM